ncbi:fluoride efflux transporter CrcB [Congregibacter brevis]|uniref:Fluoride-specific ion channel FluC n=1 Tax=Congregibacter brevis TaxID=3081201 RepID=A0ABZ0IC12_9GAMM|nr:fluoride efflux transporter CrcB [Congregibacter sp. IMCC45268]
MQHLVFIALGGACGALARYGLSTHAHKFWIHPWPMGTLLINFSGSLCIGILFVMLERAALHPDWRSVLMVGFLGAFTTFSTFSLETVELWLQGQPAMAAAYAVASVVCCVSAAALGIYFTRSLLG